MNKVAAAQGLAGTLINEVASIADNQSRMNIQLNSDKSNAQDIDFIQGLSDFQNNQTAYQAALQTYAQLQKLSLFNFIR